MAITYNKIKLNENNKTGKGGGDIGTLCSVDGTQCSSASKTEQNSDLTKPFHSLLPVHP